MANTLSTCVTGAFPLSDVMGKSFPLPLFLALSLLSSDHLADNSAQWPLSALSSPHPGPERVPPIRSCQRNA